jgi:hypothetical protein
VQDLLDETLEPPQRAAVARSLLSLHGLGLVERGDGLAAATSMGR